MSKLRADAEPFVPGTQTAQQARQSFESASRAERLLFMTFSKNAPFTWLEIRQHFTNEFGECVEYVYVHDRHIVDQLNREAEFGRIIFTTVEVVNMVMGNEEKVNVWVGDKPICLKRCVPHNRRKNDENICSNFKRKGSPVNVKLKSKHEK